MIKVTSPLLPDLPDFENVLRDIWNKQWITNNGEYHQRLEQALCDYLNVPYISLFTNGTLPIITALQALQVTGEVITTPFSFVATTHAIWWNGLMPVFVDVDPRTGCLDPSKIEAAITSKTTAIMPVPVYGMPCDVDAIQEIAKAHGLKVIYDAAHTFGVRDAKGVSPCAYGDLSTLSFHATKVYNTIEGGAIVMRTAEMKKHIDFLKNFGFANEVEVVGPGINGKMDEIRSAYGLLNLKKVDSAIASRKEVASIYRTELQDVEGITMFDEPQGVHLNYSYFPIFVDEKEYGMSRDALYFKMQERGVFGRRYFYPLISSFDTYRGLPSANPFNLPVATKLANEVICLPIHHELTSSDVHKILEIIVR